MNLDQMTLKTQDALQDAASLARQKDHSEVGCEHLLYALLRQKDGTVPPLVERIGVQPEVLLNELDSLIASYPRVSGNANIVFSSEAQNGLAKAESEMAALKDLYVSTEQILISLSQSGGAAGELLRRHGCTRNAILEALKAVRGNQTVDSNDPESKIRSLEKYCIDLTARARQDKIDPVIGRDEEIRRGLSDDRR